LGPENKIELLKTKAVVSKNSIKKDEIKPSIVFQAQTGQVNLAQTKKPNIQTNYSKQHLLL
jgi:hypothetical protein